VGKRGGDGADLIWVDFFAERGGDEFWILSMGWFEEKRKFKLAT
jgi:hypothetical protein